MSNKHDPWDLKQMQSLPLESKIQMTKQRIQAWYESWKRYEIFDKKTEKTRFVTATEEPVLKDDEYIETITPGWVYVSFSGGKDSTVLKHIVDSMYKDVPSLFVNTGLEYPEIQQFVRQIKNGAFDCFNSDVEIVRPEMRFDEVVKKYGYPVFSKETSLHIDRARKAIARKDDERVQQCLYRKRKNKKTGETYYYMGLSKLALNFTLNSNIPTSNACCDVMKKRPAKHYGKRTGRIPIIGTLASESRVREQVWLKNGCNAFNTKNPSSQPMSFWTEQDILHYIKKYNVPYCPVYGDIVIEKIGDDIPDGQINIIDYLGCYGKEDVLTTTGCDRTGCIFCMFGCHLEKEPNRFQRLKETHPRQYEYCIGGGEMVDGKWQPSKEGIGLGYVLDYIGVKYD